jgi:hypothetical protein
MRNSFSNAGDSFVGYGAVTLCIVLELSGVCAYIRLSYLGREVCQVLLGFLLKYMDVSSCMYVRLQGF